VFVGLIDPLVYCFHKNGVDAKSAMNPANTKNTTYAGQ
jgi:hypothetical protein